MTQLRSEAACSSVQLECNVRHEGWYFVRFENWDGGHDDWCPAWWNGMYWGSYRYSGIPDSRAIVGDKIVMPNVQVQAGREETQPRSEARIPGLAWNSLLGMED